MTRIWELPDTSLGNHSYVAEVADGLALAVDPARDPRPYLDLAAAHGLRIAFAIETHVHSDFISGGRELAGLGYLLLDGTQPAAVFTGGALIPGGAARTDLAGPAEPATRAAYRSAQALFALPDELTVYPTHGPGSFCSANQAGAEYVTTIGTYKAARSRRPAERASCPGNPSSSCASRGSAE